MDTSFPQALVDTLQDTGTIWKRKAMSASIETLHIRVQSMFTQVNGVMTVFRGTYAQIHAQAFLNGAARKRTEADVLCRNGVSSHRRDRILACVRNAIKIGIDIVEISAAKHQ
jgi:hypothetical protein